MHRMSNLNTSLFAMDAFVCKCCILDLVDSLHSIGRILKSKEMVWKDDAFICLYTSLYCFILHGDRHGSLYV